MRLTFLFHCSMTNNLVFLTWFNIKLSFIVLTLYPWMTFRPWQNQSIINNIYLHQIYCFVVVRSTEFYLIIFLDHISFCCKTCTRLFLNQWLYKSYINYKSRGNALAQTDVCPFGTSRLWVWNHKVGCLCNFSFAIH